MAESSSAISQPAAFARPHPDGRKLYVALPGREGYPDWRVAVMDSTRTRRGDQVDRSPAARVPSAVCVLSV